MPSYNRPIEFNLGPRPEVERFAAVIEFDSLDKERIQRFLDSLHTRCIIAKKAIVQSYNPNETSAELYFP